MKYRWVPAIRRQRIRKRMRMDVVSSWSWGFRGEPSLVGRSVFLFQNSFT